MSTYLSSGKKSFVRRWHFTEVDRLELTLGIWQAFDSFFGNVDAEFCQPLLACVELITVVCRVIQTFVNLFLSMDSG